MRVGIVDADLIGRHKHRFPNLACMKISGYHKAKGDEVTLITEYFKEDSSVFQRYYAKYDKIYVSKVFVDTPVPYSILNLSITVYGGTGFFYANAPDLSYEIHCHMPDYHLYDDWIEKKRKEGKISNREFVYYEEYSIGYTTRKCIRQCKFCVNQHSTKVEKASSVNEFLDESRSRICLLDDNILAYESWKDVFKELNTTQKYYEFKQGFDIRALNNEKAKMIVDSNVLTNNIYFAFDNIKDKDVIEEKLKLWRQHYKKNTHMYILCGFDENNVYDEEFWSRDVENTLERIRICIKYSVFPYIMRYRMYNSSPSPYRGMYINLSSWCNQRSLFSKWSLNDWVNNIQLANEKQLGKKKLYSSKRYLMEYAGKHPEIAYEYFDLKYNEHNEYNYEKNKDKEFEKIQNIELNDIKITDINLIEEDKVKIISEDSKLKNDFNVGTVSYFNTKALKSIPNKSIALTLINIKNDNITENDQELLIFIQRYLQDKGNLFIFNTNLKSFAVVKEFIEKYTCLKFEEVITLRIGEHGLKTQYCSRYIFKENNVTKIFQIETPLRKIDLLNIITKHTTTKYDTALNLFEQSNFLTMIDSNYNPQWISLRKKEKSTTEFAINYIKNQISNKSLPLLDIEDKNIG